MTTSKTKTFTMTSPFSNDFEKKWDNLLVFKNGLVDELCESNVIEYLNKPKGHASDVVPNSFSFASEVRKSVQRSKSFTADIKYVKSTEEEESAFKFDFENKINIDNVNKESKKANNSLIIKVNPEFKSVVTLENTDSLFISENFSSIDYSKTIFESSKFNAAYESLSDSYDDQKIQASEELKKYNNDILKLYKQFYDKNNNSGFSNTVGFSIKALKIKDLFALATLNTVTEIFNKDYEGLNFEDFPKLLSSLIYNFKISDITGKGTKFSEYNFIELNKIFSTTNSDFFKKAFKVKKDINIENSNETLRALSVNVVFNDNIVKEIKEKIFRLEYFSLFDKTENTFLRKNYLKYYRLNALNSNNNIIISLTGESNDILYEVNLLQLPDITSSVNIKSKVLKGNIFENKIQESLFFNEKYQIRTRNRKFKSYVDVLNYKLTDDVKSVSYENDEYIVIGVEYVKITNFYNILTFSNKFLESHIFDPVICFETINGHTRVLEEDLRSSSKTDLTINYFTESPLLKNYIKQYNLDTEEKIGELHKKFYKINVKNATALLETQDLKNISFLDRKYNKQFFYVITSQDNLGSNFKVKKVKSFVSNKMIEKEEVYYDDNNVETVANRIPLVFDEESRKSIEEKKGINLLQYSNEKADSEEGKRNNDKKPNSKNRTKASSSAEKILKITGEVSAEESKTQKEKDNTKTKPESSRKSAIKLNEAKEEVKTERLILNWVELNQISDENIKGKQRIPQNKSVRIACGFNPYVSRRGNLQPKLLKLIENAFVLTSKKYSDLTGVEIYSTSSLPLDKWLKLVEIVNEKSNDKNALVEALNNEGYKHINKSMNMTSIKKELSGLIQRIEGVRDSNHGMGFAADIRLKRGKNLVCLYSPHDDKDFEIAQFFIKTCFELGANSVGAGMYYMDEPKYKKYKRGVEGEPSVSRTLNYNGRVVVDDNFVPIRKKGQKYNGIHVDIVYNNREFFKSFDPDADSPGIQKFSRLRYALGKNYNQLIKIFTGRTSRFDKRFEKIEGTKIKELFDVSTISEKEYEDFMNKVKQKDRKESSRLVWGSTSYNSSSDKWLLDAANIGVSSQKNLSTEATELTKQKIEENKLEARQFIYKEFIKDKKKGTKHKDFIDIGTDFDEHSLKSNGYDKYFVKLSTLKELSKKNKK